MGIGCGIYLRPRSEVTRPCRVGPASGLVRVARPPLAGWDPVGNAPGRRAAGGARQASGPLRRTLDRLLHQGIDRQPTRRSIRRDAPDGPLHLRRDTPVELRPNVLGAERTCEGRAQNEGKGQADGPHSCAPCAVTATTLLRRPKPSSTAGAAGSTTQRAPSTTNAY